MHTIYRIPVILLQQTEFNRNRKQIEKAVRFISGGVYPVTYVIWSIKVKSHSKQCLIETGGKLQSAECTVTCISGENAPLYADYNKGVYNASVVL